MLRPPRLLLCCASLLASCGETLSPAAPSSAEDALEAAPPVAWGPCPDDSYYAFAPGAECAEVPQPLDHGQPRGERIPIFVARVRSGVPNAAQLWLLDGGPGSSGEELFLGLIDWFTAAMPGVDLYVPAHRGTGRSAGLVCSGEAAGSPRDTELSPAEWRACRREVTARWGRNLRHFNSRQAAEDLGALIARSRGQASKVFIYGLSYGTELAWRYLERFPHQADGVIQDSVVSPGQVFLSRADEYFDPVLERYAAFCAADDTCRSKLGADPLARVRAVFKAIDGGHCAAAGFDHARLRVTLGQALIGWRARLFALAIPYRLERCAPEDVAALQAFLALWYAPAELVGFSHALESNIGFSEFWEKPAPSEATLRARTWRQLASTDWTLERVEVYEDWPKYDAPLEWPRTSLPLLMLNGDLDVETPLQTAKVAAAHYHGAHQTFVTLPNSPHGAGYQSPTTRPDKLPCGIDIMASFVADPHAAPDTSCIAQMQALSFEDPRFAAIFFNTGSMWENVAPAQGLLRTMPTAGRLRWQ